MEKQLQYCRGHQNTEGGVGVQEGLSGNAGQKEALTMEP